MMILALVLVLAALALLLVAFTREQRRRWGADTVRRSIARDNRRNLSDPALLLMPPFARRPERAP